MHPDAYAYTRAEGISDGACGRPARFSESSAFFEAYAEGYRLGRAAANA
ncbi:hypothetical protein [Synechococcus phage Ssp-JY40]